MLHTSSKEAAVSKNTQYGLNWQFVEVMAAACKDCVPHLALRRKALLVQRLLQSRYEDQSEEGCSGQHG